MPVTINNLILINSPGLDETLPVGTVFAFDPDPEVTGLVSVLDGVTFDSGTPDDAIPRGAPTELDGSSFTLDAVYSTWAVYTKTNPETGETFQQQGGTLFLVVTSPEGEELVFLSPTNDFNPDDPWAGGLIQSVEVFAPLNVDDGIGLNLDGVKNKLALDKDVQIPCFVAGTLIDTADGRKRVEDLRPGDLVLTRDDGYMALNWVGQRGMSADEVAANPEFAAVILRAGALGPNTPERDTRVSPSHRVLVCGPRAEVLFGESEVLVPAGDLVGLPGIERDTGDVTYVHILFDSHQIVLGDGMWSESFQPAQYALDGLGAAQRDEILALFPELAGKGGARRFKAARMTLRPHEARLLFAA